MLVVAKGGVLFHFGLPFLHISLRDPAHVLVARFPDIGWGLVEQINIVVFFFLRAEDVGCGFAMNSELVCSSRRANHHAFAMKLRCWA